MGIGNTFLGDNALLYNTAGHDNTANGAGAPSRPYYQTTTGSYNTASGASALEDNTTGNFNTAIGDLGYDFQHNRQQKRGSRLQRAL